MLAEGVVRSGSARLEEASSPTVATRDYWFAEPKFPAAEVWLDTENNRSVSKEIAVSGCKKARTKCPEAPQCI